METQSPAYREEAAKPLALNKILWATDFSPSALASLPYAAAFARRYRASLYLAHVIVPHPYPLVAPEAGPYVEGLSAAASKRLAEMSASESFADIPCQALVEHGEVAEELNAMVRKHQIDLMVAGTHGRRGLRRFLLGSVSEEIWRTSPCPILTVGPHVAKQAATEVEPHQILYPTDLSEESFSAARYALSLALEYASRLTVLHVVPSAIRTSVKLLARAFRDEVRALIPAEAELWCEPECLVEPGDTAETILKVAKEKHADLIVLGVRSRKGSAHERIGHVAYRVVTEADCPVLTVRPGS
jgi:nucleotide-binding universal stress UspA family protein